MDETASMARAPDWPLQSAPGSLLLRPVWEDGAWHWHFRRNCALRPGQLLGTFVAFALASAGLALLFWIRGVHSVAFFTGLEVATVGSALWVYARHAADHEHLAISAEVIMVEWMLGGREGRAVFDPRRTRIQAQHRGLVQLCDQDRRLLIGRLLRPERRQALARDLRRAVMLT